MWQSSSSPIPMVEVALYAYIIQTWSLNCPLGVSQCIELMNNLSNGTRYEATLIKWKTKRGSLNTDPEVPLLRLK